MTQSFTPLDLLLITIVLATLAVGLPIFFVLAIRFLWDRNLTLGRSKELEKLIWQLHRIASTMEHQMNLSFPAVQPGTEEARDLAYLQELSRPAAATRSVSTPLLRLSNRPRPRTLPLNPPHNSPLRNSLRLRRLSLRKLPFLRWNSASLPSKSRAPASTPCSASSAALKILPER